jgi:diguanylate cyclase (GGDEF)-like protein/PAS domain S-box-containing protein
MNHKSATLLRLSLAMAGLTASVILLAQFFGLVPDETSARLRHRQQIVETLAVQIAGSATAFEQVRTDRLLDTVMTRNPEVLSVALRNVDGLILAEAGDHLTHYRAQPAGLSTPEAVAVPVELDGLPWGSLEVAFKFMPRHNVLSLSDNPLLALILFVMAAGGVAYFFVLRRALRALDPSAVVPERVRKALDALIEGVVIMDGDQNIALANNAFAQRIGVPAHALVGRRLSDINWRDADSGDPVTHFPWMDALAGHRMADGTLMSFRDSKGELCRLMVRASPITDGADKQTGVLATFDDITLLEQRNGDLQRALHMLKDTQARVQQHNTELQFLATRDALTGCLNRRALFTALEGAISEAHRNGTELACAMIDIDNFKSINDRFGHAVGDRAIWLLGDALRRGTRPEDFVGRYGGEEFCLLFPGIGLDAATSVVDLLRSEISSTAASRLEVGATLTFSAGVTVLTDGLYDPMELVNRADEALYLAKRAGRNRVAVWREGLDCAASSPPTLHDRREADKSTDGSRKAGTRDNVPGLMSEEQFRQRLNQALERSQRSYDLTAVMNVEIADLQRVLDALGPSVANRIHEAAITRLATVIRDADTRTVINQPSATPAPSLCRIEGGDIAVLIEHIDGPDSLERLARRVLAALLPQLEIDGRQLTTAAVIGLAVSTGDTTDADLLMRQAASACHDARPRVGIARYGFGQPGQAKARLELESDLRLAISRGEFSLHYQPKCNLTNGETTGVEALLRWQHPTRGSVSPSELISVAEETGLILPIGELVLQLAVHQLRWWHAAGLQHMRVAINVSPVQLRDHTFADRVAGILAAAGLAPQFLELEITESTCMSDVDAAAASLRHLRKLGVRIALDDFGTGHSSLALLRQLPIDSVKIDQSFVADLDAAHSSVSVIEAITVMAHELGLHCVAEGVETPAQLNTLRELGCDEAQGFLLARPMPACEITVYMQAAALHSANGGQARGLTAHREQTRLAG